MSISDKIVVMNGGVVMQTGSPQEVYDNPENLFVARFLGNPPINVFKGQVTDHRLYIGHEAVLPLSGTRSPQVPSGEVYVGIRPEGFLPDPNGPFTCQQKSVEVMGRDITVVSANPASVNPTVRSVIEGEHMADVRKPVVRFSLRPGKVFLFDKQTEQRIPFLPVPITDGGLR